MKDTPFFIIGSKRGGTTLLRLMLNKNSELGIPPESHFILTLVSYFEEYHKPLTPQELKKAKELIINHPRFETWNITGKKIDEIAEGLDSCSLSSFINAIFTYKIKTTSKFRWGEKTPEYISILPQLNQLFPYAQFIALIRDGRDVAMSLKEQGWHGWSVYQRSIYWKSCVRKMLFLKTLLYKSIFIKYEDIVINPVETLKKITAFLNVKFEQEMLLFYEDYEENLTPVEIKSGIHTKLKRQPKVDQDVYKWKTSSSKSIIWKFESVCYKELERMGYEVAFYNKNNFFHKIARYGYMFGGHIIVAIYNLYHKIFSQELKRIFRKKKLYNQLRTVMRKL